ncbi:EH domain-binding protein 1-like protein 1 isoform X2 [Hyposmocoma kahamanoa]|uniref:EH domain-binding protein 1-like protein 1 isoform X2 n=1 Tax=Hyposmocoma kahamanoa TaxID=1477025 RepID=UPI000E6D7662|nr:EH domain-binding protein 1-like protein 1 isoform X2 [Hyposmocoma kahamanoa]
MASVWKRLQRVNKRAAKFQYTASYHRVDLETSPKWKPNKLSIVWTRRSRRVITDPLEWEPSLKDPLKGTVVYTVPENHTVAVTLFKDSRTNELEDKDWTFVLEDVSSTGKRRRLAVRSINMRKYASLEPSQRALALSMDPTTQKIVGATVHLTLHCVLLREGQATDEDMQSLASLLSVNNNSDIAVLEDLDEDDTYTLSDNSTRQVLDFRQQMEEMTQSLTNSDIAATPNSVQSLNFDNSRTPTAPVSPEVPEHPPNDLGAVTPVNEELKITEKPEKSRPDFLSNLTKMAMKEPPKFSSTPSKVNSELKTDSLIKTNIFKPNAVVRRNLKPLEFKTNLNNINLDKNDNEEDDKTPTGEVEKLLPGRMDKDKTPTPDQGNVNDLPESVDYSETSQTPTEENVTPLPETTGNVEKQTSTEETAVEIVEPVPETADYSKIPQVQDLLEWCQSVTREYRSCRVTNLTTSFRSGLAFCAIVHRHRPDLIDFSGLQPDEAERNVRIALEASAKLGISQVLTVADVCARATPDRLAIMTYLFQLRAHFTGNELQVEQLGNDETESSYLVGRHDTDGSLPQDLFSREISTRRSHRMENKSRPVSQDSQESRHSQERSTPDKPNSPGAIKDVRDMFLQQSKSILNKMLSPPGNKPTAKWFAEPLKANEPQQPQPQPLPQPQPQLRLMTRKELTDPFGSDDEEDQPLPHRNGLHDAEPAKSEQQEPLTDPLNVVILSNPASPGTDSQPKLQTPELPKPTPQLLSRHDELKERARLLLEQTKKEAREKERFRRQKEKEEAKAEMNGVKSDEVSPKKSMTVEERQTMLRERARKLIADARAGIVSPNSPLSPNRATRGTVEIISKQSVMDEIAAAGGVEQLDALLARADSVHSNSSNGSRKSSASPDRSEERNSEDTRSVKSGSPLQSFSAMLDRLTPDKDNMDEGKETGSYIQSELEALEREQKAIDERAAALEKQLRRVMEQADNTQEEDRLMSQWFNLVNKKNALIRRQMQLNILEQEEDLSRRCELLARELRLSLGVDEWRKTPQQKRRERLLLQELLSAVNERDRLVQEMDEQERAIADDAEIEHNLSQVEIQRKNNCILQ